MSSTIQARVQAGVPTGGEYTTMPREEQDLHDGGFDALIDDAPAVIDEAETLAAWREIQRVATAYARKLGLDPEDTAQHVATEWVVARQKGELQTTVASFTRRWCRERSVTDATQGRSRAHAAAMGKFRAACLEAEQTLGRTLTRADKEKVADGVLAALPDSSWNKLAKGWWENNGLQTTATDYTDATYAHPSVPGADHRAADPLEPGDAVDSLTSAIEARRAGEKDVNVPLTSSETRMAAWELLSRRSNGHIPPAQTGCLSQRAVTSHRKLLIDEDGYKGGLKRACRTWENGEDDAGTEALFAPFGGLKNDFDARDRVVAMLRAKPEFAADLWGAAAQQANRQFADKVADVIGRIGG